MHKFTFLAATAISCAALADDGVEELVVQDLPNAWHFRVGPVMSAQECAVPAKRCPRDRFRASRRLEPQRATSCPRRPPAMQTANMQTGT